MINIIKNEIRGRYKFLIGAFAVIILANLYSFCMPLWVEKNMLPVGVAISSLMIMPAIIISIVYAIQAFSKDINTETAYLMFTLPQSSQNIVGGKLIYSILEYIILVGSSSGLFVINIFIFISNASKLGLNIPNFKIGFGSVIYILYEFIFLFAWLIVLIYFSIVITRTILNTKKFRVPISFIVFFLINYLTKFILNFVERILPFSIKLTTIGGLNRDFNSSSFYINSGFNGSYINANISSMIVQILLIIGMFYITTYLIDKKLDI